MQEQRPIEAELSSVAPARRWARERFEAAGLDPEVRDLLVLLVSEVVTNAVAHAAPPLLLRIDMTPDTTRVEVKDRARKMPILKDPEPTATGGRGIRFVNDLSTRWGTEPARGADGLKTVWFEVSHRSTGTDGEPAHEVSETEVPSDPTTVDAAPGADVPGAADQHSPDASTRRATPDAGVSEAGSPEAVAPDRRGGREA